MIASVSAGEELQRIMARAKADPLCYGMTDAMWPAERARQMAAIMKLTVIPKEATLRFRVERALTDLAWSIFVASPMLLWVALHLINWPVVIDRLAR